MTELKPCPFCGETDIRIIVVEKGVKSEIHCMGIGCGFHRHSYDTDKNAARRLAAAWNRRVDNG